MHLSAVNAFTAKKLDAAVAKRINRQPHLRVVQPLYKTRWVAAGAREKVKIILGDQRAASASLVQRAIQIVRGRPQGQAAAAAAASQGHAAVSGSLPTVRPSGRPKTQLLPAQVAAAHISGTVTQQQQVPTGQTGADAAASSTAAPCLKFVTGALHLLLGVALGTGGRQQQLTFHTDSLSLC